MDKHIISFEGATISQDKKVVLREVSFSLVEGDFVYLIGRTGTGKSSLLKTLYGDLKLREGKGKVVDCELLKLRERHIPDLRRQLGVVFQDFQLLPDRSVEKNLDFVLRATGWKSADKRKDRITEVLGAVGLEDKLKFFPHELSGGMRQRVSIAIALACGPRLLFADEPTTALDVTVQHQILNLLGVQQSEREMAMVLVTHDLGVVAGRTDEIIVMYAGKVVEQTTTHQIFHNTSHPYTEALLRSIPKTDQPSHTRLAAIAGRPPNLITMPSGCSFSPRCPYAQDRCFDEEPQLTTTHDGHATACWYQVGTPENQAAWDRNLAAGLPATLAVAEGHIVDEVSVDLGAGAS